MVYINQLSRLIDYADRVAQIYKMCNSTHKLLDTINHEMEQKLINIDKKKELPKEIQTDAKDFESFQTEVIEQWKQTLIEHVGQLLAQHVVLPVLQMGFHQHPPSKSRDAAYHLNSRLIHTIRFAGELKKISEITNIPVDQLIKKGRSMFKARRQECSGEGKHQAHVVAISIMAEQLRTDHPDLYQRLTYHAGHTQLVEKFANVFIGRNIDNNQAAWILKLSTIDYSKGFSKQAKEVIEDYKNQALKVFGDNTKRKNVYKKYEISKIEEAKRKFEKITGEIFFAKGRKGYKFEYKYNPKYTTRSKIKETKNEE
uniref:Uncharacterized protein n=1 Tax=Anopheles epiroticus TaxID=199890 RepID=A0A182PM02_9DIPT